MVSINEIQECLIGTDTSVECVVIGFVASLIECNLTLRLLNALQTAIQGVTA